MTRPPMLAADHIRELTRSYSTTETVSQPARGDDGRWRATKRLHTVRHPSLLDQLEQAITGASALADEDAGRSTFTSKPAARVEALDTLALIDRESHDLAADLDLVQPRRTRTKVNAGTLAARLSAISGKVGDREHAQVKAWWVAARITTQWESRPFHPKGAPCPECWEEGALRIVLSEELARCVECRHVWDGPGFCSMWRARALLDPSNRAVLIAALTADHTDDILDALVNAGALRVEDAWVPVAESGERWERRSRAEAQIAHRGYPVGGAYSSGELWDGITHIEHERRYLTDWREVGDE
jgi:hypothetical protein